MEKKQSSIEISRLIINCRIIKTSFENAVKDLINHGLASNSNDGSEATRIVSLKINEATADSLLIHIIIGFEKTVVNLFKPLIYQAKIAMDIELVGKINSDFTTQFTSNITEWQWLEPPKLKMGSGKLAASLISRMTLPVIKNKIESELEKNLNEQASLEKAVRFLNEDVNSPVFMEELLQSWFHYRLLCLKLNDISLDDKYLFFSGGLDFYSVLDHNPYSKKSDSAAPLYFAYGEPEEKLSEINIPIEFSISRIEDYIKNKLIGYRMENDGNHLLFEDLALSIEKGHFYAEARVSGSLNGNLKLYSGWKFNTDEQWIEFSDPGIELESNNIIQKAFFWFVKRNILSRLEDNNPFKINQLIDELQDILNEKLPEAIPHDGLNPSVAINSLRLVNLKLSGDKISAKVSSRSILAIDVLDARVLLNSSSLNSTVNQGME